MAKLNERAEALQKIDSLVQQFMDLALKAETPLFKVSLGNNVHALLELKEKAPFRSAKTLIEQVKGYEEILASIQNN
jgi:hypothetical protein